MHPRSVTENNAQCSTLYGRAALERFSYRVDQVHLQGDNKFYYNFMTNKMISKQQGFISKLLICKT